MDSACVWVAAGYPVLLAAIAGLWKAYTKSQRQLLDEKESKVQLLMAIRDVVKGG